jgi:cell fate regulator YaaT (PSP1 superfamily)
MQEIWEIAFKGNRREPYVKRDGFEIGLEDYVIVQAERGEDFGRVHKQGPILPPAEAREAEGAGPPRKSGLRSIVRLATDDDLKTVRRIRDEEREAYKIAKDRISERKLNMNLVDVEEQFDGNRITFYFTAEKRVDFRELVKDLAAIFKTRIELRQIGVRDEAKRLGGIGVCGRELCCSTWMVEFIPVTLKHAKEQDLSLSPSKLSGLCGRLKCCLTYESEFYKAAKREYPKAGTRTVIAGIEAEVVRTDYFKEWVFMRDADGKEFVLDLALFKQGSPPGADAAVAAPGTTTPPGTPPGRGAQGSPPTTRGGRGGPAGAQGPAGGQSGPSPSPGPGPASPGSGTPQGGKGGDGGGRANGGGRGSGGRGNGGGRRGGRRNRG